MMDRDTPPNRQFAVCVKTGRYHTSLERWKIYRVLPDAEVAGHRQIRVTDESGEDYLYPHEYFLPIELPAPLETLYLRTSEVDDDHSRW